MKLLYFTCYTTKTSIARMVFVLLMTLTVEFLESLVEGKKKISTVISLIGQTEHILWIPDEVTAQPSGKLIKKKKILSECAWADLPFQNHYGVRSTIPRVETTDKGIRFGY